MSDRRREDLASGISSLIGSAVAVFSLVFLRLPWEAYMFGAVVGVLVLAYRAKGAR